MQRWHLILVSVLALFTAVALALLIGQRFSTAPRRSAMGTTFYQRVAEQMPWSWSDEQASLNYCIATHLLPDYHADVHGSDEYGRRHELMIRVLSHGREVYAWKGYNGTVFTRSGDTLYLANFHPMATGCCVVAVDLKTGKQLWSSRLKGSSCTWNSEYQNRVNIATDGNVITVHGNESYSRYIEFVDMQTGETLGHKEFLH